MSPALKVAAAAVVAALVETACLWVLGHALLAGLAIAFALSFAAGYLALFVALSILRPSAATPPVREMLGAYALFGLAALLLVEIVLYLCADLLGLGLAATNALAVVAVVCWVAFGWRFRRCGGRGPGPGSASAEERA